MDYREIDTAAEILAAFKGYANAGEEIQLFESLAQRDEPPLNAFVEILKNIKLETVLALTIQAFGKITNDDVKARLKGSEDLLELLCDRAKSGSSDLIKWSAATTIERLVLYGCWALTVYIEFCYKICDCQEIKRIDRLR
jgi:hypothetical protein